MVKDNISRLKSDISLICQRLGRDSKEITIVCVTKFATVSMIEEALKSGMSHIGENKVQEALKKYSNWVASAKITRHMVGHLQTNKVKDALKIFDVIQSVDSFHLAKEIEKAAAKLNRRIDILIQVNTAKEAQKFGASQDEALPLIREVLKFEHLHVLGLMAVAPLTDKSDIVRNCFRRLRQLRDKAINEFSGQKNIKMKFLSMGMSSDYKIALEEGSNMVRIGSAIFKNA